MKRVFVLCAALVGVAGALMWADAMKGKEKTAQRTLRILCAFDTPPFSFTQAGRKEGFEVDLGDAIGKELGAKVVWIQKGFNIPAYVSMLKHGAADAAMSCILITPERERRMTFTMPYYQTNLAVATIKDMDWYHQDFVNGLKDMDIGVLRGSPAYDWARKNLSAKRVQFYSPQRMVQALRDEQIYCIMLDEDVLKWTMKDNPYRFQLVERNLDHEYYGIAVKKGNTALAGEINAALKKLDDRNVYGKIYNKWFSRKVNLPVKPAR